MKLKDEILNGITFNSDSDHHLLEFLMNEPWDKEVQKLSDKFIQSQIDYYNKLSGKNYYYGNIYKYEKWRRQEIVKEAKKLLLNTYG